MAVRVAQNNHGNLIILSIMNEIHNKQTEWQDGRAKDITFIVTKDCQLACIP